MKIKATRVMEMIYEVDMTQYHEDCSEEYILQSETEDAEEDPECMFSNELLYDEIKLEIVREDK